MSYENNLEFALKLDQEDPIAAIRNEFSIPKMENGGKRNLSVWQLAWIDA